MKKIFAIVLSVVMLAAVFAGCSGGNESADGDKVIKIGVFEPVTGENGGGGFQEVLAIRYANTVRPTVDINGETYTIELVEADNKSDKTEAVSAANSLISAGVSVILGSYGSGVSIAAGEIFADNEIPAIGCSCTSPQVTLGNDYYVRVCYTDPFQGTILANYAMQEGATKAAVITQLGDDYSSGLGSYFVEAFAAVNGEDSIIQEQFQTNQTDFRAILTNIKAFEPDVIFAPSSITTAPLIIRQARELGIDVNIMAGDTWQNYSIIEAAGEDAEGVVCSTFFDENDTSSEIATDFVTGFKAFLNENPSYLEGNGGDGVAAVSALGYDAYMVAIEAIESAQSTDPVAIRDALAGVDMEGVTGRNVFDENGDAIKDIAYINMIQDGAFVFVKTVTLD